MFLCVFCFCREDYNGITTFTELLNFTGKICLFYINKELHFCIKIFHVTLADL